MKYLYKFFVFFLFPLLSVAQGNYKPGYVIKLNGDSIPGFIDYKERNENPGEFRFKTVVNTGRTEVYSIKNARAVGITGLEYFQRFILPISQDQVEVGKLETKPDSSFLIDTVFLRILNKGKHLSLYNYVDNIKPHFFIVEATQTQPLELSFHAYYNPDVSESVQYINRYRTQLVNLAQKYGVNIHDQIVHAGYNEADIVKIVIAINGDSSSPEFTPKNLFGTRFFVGAGLNNNHLKFDGTISFSERSIISPKVSAGLDLIPNKNVQRFILRAEVSFTANEYKLNGSLNGNPTTFNFTQNIVSIIPQLFYNVYNTAFVKVFLDVGASFNLAAYNQYKLVEQIPNFNPVVFNNYPQLEKFWVSFPIKTGVLINKNLDLYVGFSPSANVSNVLSSDNTVGTVVAYQLGINYLFGVK